MKSPYSVIPFNVPGADAFLLDPVRSSPLVRIPPMAPAGADGYWLFGDDYSDRRNLVTGARAVRALSGSIAGGTGYAANTAQPLTFGGGTLAASALPATGFVIIDGGGVPRSLLITNHGDYSVPPTATVTPSGGGSGAAVTIVLGAEPTANSKSISIASGVNGLATPTGVSQHQTVFGVWRRDLSQLATLIDLSFSTKDPTTTGAIVFTASANGGEFVLNGAPHGQLEQPASSSPGNVFVAISFGENGRAAVIGTGNGTVLSFGVTSGLLALDPNRRRIGIGNVNDNGVVTAGSEVFSFGTIPRALSAAEMTTLYQDEVNRLAGVGVAVF